MATLCPPESADPLCDPSGGSLGKIFLVEIVATFIFVSVNVNVIYENGSKELIINALGIGLTLATVLTCASTISGASCNPAVGLVQPIFQNVKNGTSLNSLIAHFLGPLIGGILAGLF